MNKQEALRQLAQEEPITLEQLLNQREKRAARQARLLAQGGVLVCFTLNTAGAVKTCPLFTKAFEEGMRCIKEQLQWRQIPLLLEERLCGAAGEELYLLVQGEPRQVKWLMLEIEETFPLGRLFDIDVLSAPGRKVSREEWGHPPRKCLLCEERAALCARSQRHSIALLQEKTVEMICTYFNQQFAQSIAALCSQALLYEVAVTPKPGLVDRAGSGAHRDMDIFTFQQSACALTPYFTDCALWGIQNPALSPAELFAWLRYPGRRAEQAMYQATQGVNTHKGVIFSMGILCAAIGRLFNGEGGWQNSQAVFSLCRQMCAGLLEDFSHLPPQTSPGERLYRQYGVLGARGEAAEGFPSVREIGLPVFKQCIAQGKNINDAGVVTLLHLIAVVEDTNILHRSGREGLTWLQAQAQAALKKEDVLTAAARLDRLAVEKNISPGGCADLLALTYFFWLLENA